MCNRLIYALVDQHKKLTRGFPEIVIFHNHRFWSDFHRFSSIFVDFKRFSKFWKSILKNNEFEFWSLNFAGRIYFEFTTCDCTNGVSTECQLLKNTNCLANVLKSSKFVENRWKSRKSIIGDFNKISYLWHQTTKKCEGFAEFCLRNIWDTCKHHTMVLSLFTAVFGFHIKKIKFPW